MMASASRWSVATGDREAAGPGGQRHHRRYSRELGAWTFAIPIALRVCARLRKVDRQSHESRWDEKNSEIFFGAFVVRLTTLVYDALRQVKKPLEITAEITLSVD
jgi:hypothetical protein